MKSMYRVSLVLLALLLALVPVACAESYAPIDLTTEQRAAANLFLSNFTEIGFGAYYSSIGTDSDDQTLVDFAHDHLWFNSDDAFEYGEWGEYNCRVSDEKIQKMIDKYIYDARTVDLSQTRFEYKDGYYYHTETGGWMHDGFAAVTSITPIQDDQYFISFMTFGSADAWDNDVMSLTLDEVWAQYGHPFAYGHALVHATDLADRSTYQLIEMK